MPVPATLSSRPLRIIGLAALGVVAATLAAGAGLLPGWLTICAIIFAAAAISSIVGFAFSAIAGAMILHHVPDSVEAVRIMMIASIGIQAYSVTRLSQAIEWARCAPFILGGFAALPIGIALLLNLQPRTCILAMGAALIVYGLYMLRRRPVLIRSGEHRVLDALIGALGGITGPLAALPGMWTTIWCGMRGWDKSAQRAVYQPYILAMQIAGFGALCLARPPATFNPALLAYALPGLAGAVLGLRVFHALSDAQFQRLINLALVASGVVLALR
jgi:uncharacterized membrane protein YfcA